MNIITLSLILGIAFAITFVIAYFKSENKYSYFSAIAAVGTIFFIVSFIVIGTYSIIPTEMQTEECKLDHERYNTYISFVEEVKGKDFLDLSSDDIAIIKGIGGFNTEISEKKKDRENKFLSPMYQKYVDSLELIGTTDIPEYDYIIEHCNTAVMYRQQEMRYEMKIEEYAKSLTEYEESLQEYENELREYVDALDSYYNYYKIDGIVINTEGTSVTVETTEGECFSFIGTDYVLGQNVILEMDNNSTESICDDCVINAFKKH